ncbi:MAG TPA: peptide deformylase, partial [Alphaproteobacteria bacterium]|nr:peptide deformylase [Alphaproteobacteria bacterium]
MALLKIAKMGNPVLRSPAQEVPDPNQPQIRALVSDMVETMVDAGGVGLAAPQVHVPLRIVIFHPPKEATSGDGEASEAEEEEEAVDPGELTILINPVIEPLTDEQALGWEGCLSVPGMRGLVPRFTRIRYTGLDINGHPINVEAEGFHARVVQHECDHLDGVLYPQRMTDMRLLGFNDEWERHPLNLTPPEEEDSGRPEAEATAGGEPAKDG